jgi:hypothetical protein
MACVDLVHPGGTRQILGRALVNKCTLFETNMALLTAPYSVLSAVPLSAFDAFVTALDDGPIEITNANFRALSQLADEFGFGALAAQLSAFRASPAFSAALAIEAPEMDGRVAALEERALLRGRENAGLQAAVARQAEALAAALARIAALETEVARLAALAVSAARTAPVHSQAPASPPAPASAQAPAPAPSQGIAPAPSRAPAPSHALARARVRSPPPAQVPPRASAGLAVPAVARPASLIMPEFPSIFGDFRGKRFKLLWRGSRDGFGAREFHARCDGHRNTLTVVQDIEGFAFGGFTPLEWDSADRLSKRDDSLRSFLFTITNPHHLAPRRFPLKEERRRSALYSDSRSGPRFGGTWADLYIADGGNTDAKSYASFGTSYLNDTGVDGRTFFTRGDKFTLREIEVFEVVE